VVEDAVQDQRQQHRAQQRQLATQMLINGMLLGSSPQCLQNRYQFITNDNFVNADNECFVMSGKIDEIYCKL
jgi:hypothetical protein